MKMSTVLALAATGGALFGAAALLMATHIVATGALVLAVGLIVGCAALLRREDRERRK